MGVSSSFLTSNLCSLFSARSALAVSRRRFFGRYRATCHRYAIPHRYAVRASDVLWSSITAWMISASR
jgi:hypothetical protein